MIGYFIIIDVECEVVFITTIIILVATDLLVLVIVFNFAYLGTTIT